MTEKTRRRSSPLSVRSQERGDDGEARPVVVETSTAGLAEAILLEEQAREDETAGVKVDLSRQLFAGDDVDLSVREVFQRGGVGLIGVLFALNLVDEFTFNAINILAPDIQKSLDISDSVIGVTGVLAGGFILLGSLPIAVLSDRMRRLTVISITSVILGAVTGVTGLVRNAWQLAFIRVGAGLGKGNHPAYQSLLADAFPITGRARAYAVFNSANPIANLIGPVLAGVIATTIGGDEGWRWTFAVLSIPTVILGLLAATQREPERGGNERRALFGEDADSVMLDESLPRMSVAFARLRRIRTFFFFLVGLAAIGYGLFAFPIFASLFLEDRFGLDALGRGLVLSLGAIGALVGNALGGVMTDREFEKNPERTVMGCALLMLGYVLVVPALYMPNIALFVIVLAIAQASIGAAFIGFTAIVSAILPYKLRAQGFALMGLYLFVFGALLGALITGSLSGDHGERFALTVVIPPPMLIGAAVMAYGARFVRDDMTAVVTELEEEKAEIERQAAGGDAAPLQVRALDFSYGSLQVLFDVSIDVHAGEVLALLGTNGAGKSTLLNCITGLAMPDRGVIRYNGRTITLSDPVDRVKAGIVMVPGGKAVFPTLTVSENLLIGAYSHVWDTSERNRRKDRVLELFPKLRDRLDQPAGTMSGGEQQMLAIAKGLLLEPELLCIDELSLGLAPVVVQELLGVVEALKADGVTMIIVEQSVNVALSLADRAIFMEKGRVRFEGPAQDLLERDDLVRAVFLGGSGG